MIPLSEYVTAWRLDLSGIVLAVALACVYGWACARARALGPSAGPGPVRIAAFYGLGIGLLLWATCGFLGVYSSQLRWAFALKAVLLLFLVPLILGLGKPLTALRAALSPVGQTRWDAVLSSRAMKIITSPLASPLIALALFSSFLTPAFLPLRSDALLSSLFTLLVPCLGMALTLPVVENINQHRTGATVSIELLFLFIELLIDAIPGIALRLSPAVLDRAGAWSSSRSWFPSPLRDQQIAGEILWFLCEVMDLPLLILLFVRFQRTDRAEAKSYDDLTVEELQSLQAAHLGQRRS